MDGFAGNATMLTVGNNIAALKTYNNLRRANAQMGNAMAKLSSGYRINTAADGPADLIESERLRGRIEGLEKAIRNTRTSGNIMDIADGALGEVQGIVRRMQQLTVHAQNSGITSKEQIAADQAELDSGLQAIDRILRTTNYAGRKLLDNMAPILSATGNAAGGTVVTRDKADELLQEYSRANGGNGTLDLAGYLKSREEAGDVELRPLEHDAFDENGLLREDLTITVPGGTGDSADDEVYAFSAGTSVDDMVAALRQRGFTQEERDALDPNYVPPTQRVTFEKGKVEFSLDDIAYLQGKSDAEAAGFLTDALKTVRGVFLKADGNNIDLSKLSEGDRKMLELGNSLQSMNMNQLGSTEVVVGVDENGKDIVEMFSLNDLYSSGRADLRNNADAAYSVLRQAGKDISAQRAQIAATRKYAVAANENLLMSELESYSRAESYLRDQDMASGMVEFTRSKVVSQVGTQMLKAVLDQSQQVLDLFA